MRLLERWRARSIRRELADPRRQAVSAHTQQLTRFDPVDLVALVNPNPGAWGVPELATSENDIEINVEAFRAYDQATSDVLFRVSHKGRFGRWFADGFAVRDGTISPLTDDEWAHLD